jgi:hypothetical protein
MPVVAFFADTIDTSRLESRDRLGTSRSVLYGSETGADPTFVWNLLQFLFGSFRDRRSVKNTKGQRGN